MSTSNAFFAHGTTLSVYDVNGANPIQIAELVDLPANLSQATLDATNHASGGWKESKPGLKEGGVWQLSLAYVPGDAGHQLLLALFNDSNPNKMPRKFELKTPGSPAITIDFYAYVTGLQYPAKHDDLMRGTIALSTTGPITVVYA